MPVLISSFPAFLIKTIPASRFRLLNSDSYLLMKKLLILLAVLVTAGTALAQTVAPTLIPFQGRLTDQNGVAYTNKQYTIVFQLYDQAVGGTLLDAAWGTVSTASVAPAARFAITPAGPAVVGCGDATARISEGAPVTVSCAEGDTGYVYAGALDYDESSVELDAMPTSPVKIMMNVGNPDRAFDFAQLPHQGVGLARLEFIINRMIGVHPRALLEYDSLQGTLKDTISKHLAGYDGPIDFFVRKLAEGISQIAAAFHPQPVIVRLSDFKSNEYANLIGGPQYEPHEENPMLGFRGASRYIDPTFRPCFELECRALKHVRDVMGLTNVQVMVPFVRTLEEARAVTGLLAQNGLARGDNGLKVIMMCELPTNALLADQYLEHFDGMSIGSNDMTQLVLGLDRDSGIVAKLFDERDPAVRKMLSMAIRACRSAGKYIGICGQGPSDHPDLARWLVEEGIESLSLNPDTVISTWLMLSGQPQS